MAAPLDTAASPAPVSPPAGEPTPVLAVMDLGKDFGEIAALRGLSFEVFPGEAFGIAGPNGAGKSTLFNLIAGKYSGTGRILFEGRDILGLKPHRACRRGIGRTWQIPAVFDTMTVEENVRVGARFGRPSDRTERERIRSALAAVGMEEKADRTAKHLDLLEKKLTMLAAALATNPSLLLLDEPMGGLAPTEIDRFGALIGGLNRETGLTLIVIEHLIRKLVQLTDRMLILYHGERIALGRPVEVVNDPRVIDLYIGTGDYTAEC